MKISEDLEKGLNIANVTEKHTGMHRRGVTIERNMG